MDEKTIIIDYDGIPLEIIIEKTSYTDGTTYEYFVRVFINNKLSLNFIVSATSIDDAMKQAMSCEQNLIQAIINYKKLVKDDFLK